MKGPEITNSKENWIENFEYQGFIEFLNQLEFDNSLVVLSNFR